MRRTVRLTLAGSALAIGLAAAAPGTAFAADPYNAGGGAGGSTGGGGTTSGGGTGTTGTGTTGTGTGAGTTTIVPISGNGSGTSSSGLPFTGFELGAALAVAGGSIALGSAAVVGSRRRTRVTLSA